MIEVVMKFGNSDQLPAAIENGTLYFTLDTMSIYFDMNDKRTLLYENLKERLVALEGLIGDINTILDMVNNGTDAGTGGGAAV